MRVLIGCERSGIVREAFRRRGHNAVSCDLAPAEDKSRNHITRDIVKVLMESSGFWDLAILHPPCTCIALCGNSTYGIGKPKHSDRVAALDWTADLWWLARKSARRVALENPMNVLGSRIGRKTQVIQPYMFGHLEQKETWLWLFELPELHETLNVYEDMMKLPKRRRERIHYMGPSETRGQDRSRTYQGIADAMAEQWGSL